MYRKISDIGYGIFGGTPRGVRGLGSMSENDGYDEGSKVGVK